MANFIANFVLLIYYEVQNNNLYVEWISAS